MITSVNCLYSWYNCSYDKSHYENLWFNSFLFKRCFLMIRYFEIYSYFTFNINRHNFISWDKVGVLFVQNPINLIVRLEWALQGVGLGDIVYGDRTLSSLHADPFSTITQDIIFGFGMAAEVAGKLSVLATQRPSELHSKFSFRVYFSSLVSVWIWTQVNGGSKSF